MRVISHKSFVKDCEKHVYTCRPICIYEFRNSHGQVPLPEWPRFWRHQLPFSLMTEWHKRYTPLRSRTQKDFVQKKCQNVRRILINCLFSVMCAARDFERNCWFCARFCWFDKKFARYQWRFTNMVAPNTREPQRECRHFAARMRAHAQTNSETPHQRQAAAGAAPYCW